MVAYGAIVLYTVAPLCCAVACVLTGWQLWRHWHSAQEPQALRHTMVILLLVPVYALCSLGSLVWPRVFLYLDLLKDGYEALVLWHLFQLLLHYFHRRAPSYLGIQQQGTFVLKDKCSVEHALAEHQAHQAFEWFEQMPPQRFLLLCNHQLWPTLRVWHCVRWALLQYALWRLLLPLPTLVTYELGLYGHREPGLNAYVWLTAVTTLSISVAVWSLYALLRLIKPAIWMHAPMQKFLSIKLMVLGLFWQSIVLSLLQQANALPLQHFAGWQGVQLAEALHATLSCAELACLAVLNAWIFAADEHQVLSSYGDGGDEIVI